MVVKKINTNILAFSRKVFILSFGMADNTDRNREISKDYRRSVSQPSDRISNCILCGMPTTWGVDKNGYVYVSCPCCQGRVFPRGTISVAGVEVLHKIIHRIGVVQFQKMVQLQVLHNNKVNAKRKREVQAS